jgi:ubiquinone/menaquinone biosynthesis C-methylase UbiE
MTDPQSSGFQVGLGVPDHYDAYVAPLMKPFIAALIAAVVRPAHRVLDVACGTGFATRAASIVVGSGGTIAAVDVNPAMIEKARSQSTPGDVEWHVASALELPFEDRSFDAVICQQGLQFFPSPADGLAEMHRVLRPGGSLGTTVWAPIHLSPYLAAQASMMSEQCGIAATVLEQAIPPEGEALLHRWAFQAGLSDAHVETLQFVVEFPPLQEHIVNHLRALPWSGPFFALSPTTQTAAVEAMIDSLASYTQPDGSAHIPTASLLLTATR